MATKEELKPCPFCGGEADMGIRLAGDMGKKFYVVKCRDCNAMSSSEWTRELAASAWNSRVCVSEKPEMLDTNSVAVKKLDTSTPCVLQNTETLDTNGSYSLFPNNSELWSFVRFCRNANDLWAVHDRARDLLATCKGSLQAAPKPTLKDGDFATQARTVEAPRKPTYEELEKMVKLEWRDGGDVSRADVAPHFYFKAEGCGELNLVYFYGRWPDFITIRENGEKDLEAQKQNARKFLVDLVADALGVERSGKCADLQK